MQNFKQADQPLATDVCCWIKMHLNVIIPGQIIVGGKPYSWPLKLPNLSIGLLHLKMGYKCCLKNKREFLCIMNCLYYGFGWAGGVSS